LLGYIKGVKKEIGKVTWLSRKQVAKLTSSVIAISIAAGLFLQLIDIGLQYIIRNYL